MYEHLRLASGCRAELHRQLERSVISSRECCGFLLGAVEGGVGFGSAVLSVRNLARQADCFFITWQAKQCARQIARQRRLELLAVYHTHPHGEARLSGADRLAIRASDLPWILVAPGPASAPALAAFAASTAAAIPVSVGP